MSKKTIKSQQVLSGTQSTLTAPIQSILEGSGSNPALQPLTLKQAVKPIKQRKVVPKTKPFCLSLDVSTPNLFKPLKSRITDEIVNNAMLQVFNKRDRKEYKAELIPVRDAVDVVADRYPWLHGMHYINNLRLFYGYFVPDGFMLNNKFAVDLSFLTTNNEGLLVKVPSYYLTRMGLDFLLTLLDDLVWESDELMAHQARLKGRNTTK